MPNEFVTRKSSISILMLAIVAVAQLGASVHAATQGGGARSVSGACLCGNENGTAFPTGQCFEDRTCGEALAETGGSPCTGTDQGNCPNGRFCLDANSTCGVPTCAIQTASCEGSCSVGTGTAPYEACATVPVTVPAMPIVLTTVLAMLLVASAARILGKQRHSATSATLAAIAAMGLVAALSAATVGHHDSHACHGAAASPWQ